MSDVRHAVVFSAASQYTLQLISLVSIIVVARLLTPGEIGTFAIASGIVMIMTEFRLLGASMYLVRENDLSAEKIRSALGLTIIISWGLGALVFFGAPLAAEYYKLPALANILRILSLSFFLAPYVSIPSALLMRAFQFKTLFYISIVASVTGVASTIGLILLDYSFYSMALGQTINIVIQFLIFSFCWPSETPRYPQFRGLKPVASFGIISSVASLLNKVPLVAPDLVIGKMGTITQVGIFSRGLGLIDFLSRSLSMGVTPVALPYLSETKRTGGDVNWAYMRAIVLVGGIVWPVLAVASLASLPVIRLFFGWQWDAAAPLSAWLALWAMLRSTHMFSFGVLLASGKEKVIIAKEALVFVVYIVGIITAFPYGLEAIAISFVLAGIWDLLVTSFVLSKAINLDILKFARALLPNLAVTAVCWGVTLLVRQFVEFEGDNYWLPILVLVAVLPPVWLLSLKVLNHPLYSELSRLLLSLLARIRFKEKG